MGATTFRNPISRLGATVRSAVAGQVDRRFEAARARVAHLPRPDRRRHAGDVVVLVPGFAHDWESWAPLAGALAQAGYPDQVRFAYDPWREGFDELAGRLRDLVAGLAARGARRVHLVAHSMGGILVREALRGGGPVLAAVGTVVTLGSPHRGSPWARLPGLPASVRELRLGSARLRRLRQAVPGRPTWVSVSGGRDTIVPPFCTRWGGARHVRIAHADHGELLRGRDAAALAVAALRAAAPECTPLAA